VESGVFATLEYPFSSIALYSSVLKSSPAKLPSAGTGISPSSIAKSPAKSVSALSEEATARSAANPSL
jgi:hypothetical protein